MISKNYFEKLKKKIEKKLLRPTTYIDTLIPVAYILIRIKGDTLNSLGTRNKQELSSLEIVLLLLLILSWKTYKILRKRSLININKSIVILLFIPTIYIISYAVSFLINFQVLKRLDWFFIIILVLALYVCLTSKKHKIISIIIKIMLTILSFIYMTLLFGDKTMDISKFIEKINNVNSLGYIILLILSYTFIFKFRMINEKIIKYIPKDLLYKERTEDLRYIIDFIKSDSKIYGTGNILGVDGSWGDGKTFLIDKVQEEISKDSHEVIRINPQLISEEEVYPYIMSNLDRVLLKNNIFFGHSGRVVNSFFKGIDSRCSVNIKDIFDTKTYSDEIFNFQTALNSCKKKIILIFDDLDRIESKEKLQKILSFICEFSSFNIKSLILYDQKKIEGIDVKFNRNYIEKYIPFSRKLTPISFGKLLEDEVIKLGLDTEKFTFIYYLIGDNYYCINKNFDFSSKDIESHCNVKNLMKSSRTLIPRINPRKMKLFLVEYQKTKKYLEDKGILIDDRILIGYFFLKTIMYNEFYEKIKFIAEENSFDMVYPVSFTYEEDKKIEKIKLEDIELVKNFLRKMNGKMKPNKISEMFKINGIRMAKEDLLNVFYKFDIKKIPETAEELRELNVNIEKKLEKLELEKESENNLVIRVLLNWFLYSFESDTKVTENRNSIVKAIVKLNFLGSEEHISREYNLYLNLKEVLLKEISKRIELYRELLTSYHSGPLMGKGIFMLGDIKEEKIIEVLEIFATKEEKMSFLEIIIEINKKKLTDIYFYILKKSELIEYNEIREIIVDKFMNNEIEIQNKDSLDFIIDNLNKIIYTELDSLEDHESKEDYIDYIQKELDEKKKKSLYHLSESYGNSINKYKEFLCKVEVKIKKYDKLSNQNLEKGGLEITSSISKEYFEEAKKLAKLDYSELKEKIDELFRDFKYNERELEIIISELEKIKNNDLVDI